MAIDILCVFKNSEQWGGNFLYEYLMKSYRTEITAMVSDIEKWNPSIVLTNDLSILQNIPESKKVILYLTDSCLNRQDDVALWRRNLTNINKCYAIFSASNYISQSFVDNYKIPCKTQHIYIPQQPLATPKYIVCNEMIFLEELTLKYLNTVSDLSEAKLYIHLANGTGSSSYFISFANRCGVPCLLEDLPYFKEFVLPGNRILPQKALGSLWTQSIKLALRDHSIDSQRVYQESSRYESMPEIDAQIKKALKDLQPAPMNFQQIQQVASKRLTVKRISQRPHKPAPPQRNVPREEIRPIVSSDLVSAQRFIDSMPNTYVGVGGFGDALLLIASCFEDNDPAIIFGANSGSQSLVENLFDIFGIPSKITRNFNRDAEANQAFRLLVSHPHFRGKAHVPDKLNYGDWNDATKYHAQMKVRLPLLEKFGKLPNPRKTSRVIGIGPRGSEHSSKWKQRFLTNDEYHKIVHKYLNKNYTVITFGSIDDLQYYGTIKNNNAIWVSSEFMESWPTPRFPINMQHMFKLLNSCDEVLSVDSWVKTYSGLAGIPTTIIMNRYQGKSEYRNDPSDRIFLNPILWGFQIANIESIIS